LQEIYSVKVGRDLTSKVKDAVMEGRPRVADPAVKDIYSVVALEPPV
jgi:hypothetical protein